MAFSENLKKIREENGVSQAELAQRLGVSQSLVARWERGSRLPDIVIGAEIEEQFGIPVKNLVNGTDEKREQSDNP